MNIRQCSLTPPAPPAAQPLQAENLLLPKASSFCSSTRIVTVATSLSLVILLVELSRLYLSRAITQDRHSLLFAATCATSPRDHHPHLNHESPVDSHNLTNAFELQVYDHSLETHNVLSATPPFAGHALIVQAIEQTASAINRYHAFQESSIYLISLDFTTPNSPIDIRPSRINHNRKDA